MIEHLVGSRLGRGRGGGILHGHRVGLQHLVRRRGRGEGVRRLAVNKQRLYHRTIGRGRRGNTPLGGVVCGGLVGGGRGGAARVVFHIAIVIIGVVIIIHRSRKLVVILLV